MRGINGRIAKLERMVGARAGQAISQAGRRLIDTLLTLAYDPGGVHPDLPTPAELDSLEAQSRELDTELWDSLDLAYGGNPPD